VNYSSAEANVLIGKASSEIETVLGYRGEEELIHRDNLVAG
jgi:glutamate 5-kinase